MKALEVWLTNAAQWELAGMAPEELDHWVKRIDRLGRRGNPLPRRTAQRLRGARDLYRVVGPGGFVVLRSGRRRLLVLAFVRRRPDEIVRAILELDRVVAAARKR